MITQFVNKGTDLEALNKSYESMPLEQQEELAKALKKDGLVLVDVQVNGKHGVYTRKQWKKASDVKKNEGKSSKGSAPDADKQKAVPQVIKGKHMSDLKDNLKKHGLVLDSIHNNGIQDDEEVTMYDKDKNTYTAKASRYSDGGVELRSIKKEADESLDNNNSISEEEVSKNYVTKYIKLLGGLGHESMTKNVKQVLSGESKEFISQEAKDEAIRATKQCQFTNSSRGAGEKGKKIAEHCDNILKKLKDTPVRNTQGTKTSNNSTNGVGKNFSALVDSDDSDSADTKLEKEAHNLCVGRLKSKGINLKNAKEVSKELMGYAIELKEKIKKTMTKQEKEHYNDLANTINNWSGDYSASKDDSTNSVPKTKADIQSMLASGKSRNDIIELAKKSGISWKENGHEGINWMRCCMALTKASK